MSVDPASIADRYFANMREANVDGLAAMFAEDATMGTPDGRELAGRETIRRMYAALFAAQRPIPNHVAKVVGAQAIAFEIEGRLPDGTPTKTANFFFFNEAALIQRVSAYRREPQKT